MSLLFYKKQVLVDTGEARKKVGRGQHPLRILQNMKSCGLSAPRWHESPSPPAAGASGGDAGSAGGSAGGPAANPSKHTPREARRQVPGGAAGSAGGAAGGLAANPPKNRRVSVVVLRTTLTRVTPKKRDMSRFFGVTHVTHVTSVVVRQRSTIRMMWCFGGFARHPHTTPTASGIRAHILLLPIPQYPSPSPYPSPSLPACPP